MRILITDFHCPGDTLEDTAAIRDLIHSNPGIKVNVNTTANELWNNNPLLDRSITAENADKVVKIKMPMIHQSNQNGQHVIDCIEEYLMDELHIRIKPGDRRADLYLTDDEKDNDRFFSDRGLPPDGCYWLVNAGYKDDFQCKWWGRDNFQSVIDATQNDIVWVQIGSLEHHHDKLDGAIDLRGKTSHRDLVRIMYRAAGVLTGVSYPMHLASMRCRNHPAQFRPCVVIAGGREAPSFTQYPNHHHASTVGMLDCCRNGGCWKGKFETCKYLLDGLPGCMRLITPEAIAALILRLNR